jgi:hypothetical protein
MGVLISLVRQVIFIVVRRSVIIQDKEKISSNAKVIVMPIAAKSEVEVSRRGGSSIGDPGSSVSRV